MAIAANFAWPWTVYEDRLVYAGRVEQFPPGTVMSFAAIHGSSGRPAFHLVRLDHGEFLALLDRDPHLGDPVPYRPDFVFDGRTGWFRNPLHGKTFDMAGYRVFGPSPRGLDRLPDLVDGAIQQFERELVRAAAGTIGTLAKANLHLSGTLISRCYRKQRGRRVNSTLKWCGNFSAGST